MIIAFAIEIIKQCMAKSGINFNGGIADDNRNPWFPLEIFKIVKRQLLNSDVWRRVDRTLTEELRMTIAILGSLLKFLKLLSANH